MYMNVCVSNKSSVHETFKTAGTNLLKLVQTGSIMFQIFEIMNFEIFSWKFLLEIFKISNLYTLKIIEVYSIAPPSDPFKVKKNFAQKWIAWNDLWTFNLETPFGNTTWTHHFGNSDLETGDQKHICNLLHIYGLCKIKCICNLRYIFNHSWKWHEYVCLSLYIKNGLGLGNHTFRPTRIIRISLKYLIFGSKVSRSNIRSNRKLKR